MYWQNTITYFSCDFPAFCKLKKEKDLTNKIGKKGDEKKRYFLIKISSVYEN